MLVLTRRVGEAIIIGNGMTVKVLAADGQRIHLGVDAPENVHILREELLSEAKNGNQERRGPTELEPECSNRPETPLSEEVGRVS